MKRTSSEQRPWKDKMIQGIEDIIELRQKLQNSPSFKSIVKFLIALGKIVIPIILRKVLDHFFKSF